MALSSLTPDSLLIQQSRSTLMSFLEGNKLVGFTEVTYRNMDKGLFIGAQVSYGWLHQQPLAPYKPSERCVALWAPRQKADGPNFVKS